MVRRACLACVVVTVASWAIAAEGELKYVACPAEAALYQGSRTGFNGSFSKPPKDAGTVHRGAVWAVLAGDRNRIAVAIDARKPDANAPDVIRFDFTGEGKFDDANVADLKVGAAGQDAAVSTATFGPATLSFQRDGRAIPVVVQGNYTKQNEYRWLAVKLTVAVEGKCRFDDKAYPVRVVDASGKLAVGTPGELVRRDGETIGARKGDTVLVDTGDGSFGKATARGYLGQPILVDGVWYRVRLSQDGKSVLAERLADGAGCVHVDRGKWSAVLLGCKHVMHVEAGRDPVPVPADRYAVTEYSEHVEHGQPGKPPRDAHLIADGRGELRAGEAKLFDVQPGKTLELKASSPLTAGLTVKKEGDTVNFALDLKTQSGAAVSYITLAAPAYERPKAPRIEVLDKDGRRVHQATMAYG